MTAAGVADADNFDTISPRQDFYETVTSELVDVVGTASANPVDGYNGGVIEVVVGDEAITPCSARLQMTVPPSHVQALNAGSWYGATLVRPIRPPDDELGDTLLDCLGLWSADTDRVGLGIFNGSGGSVTNWVGYAGIDSSFTTVLGPALDGEESPVWHLFEMWFHDGALHFYIDGVEFDDTIAAAALPGLPATMAMMIARSDVGSPAAPAFDKACVITLSPRVGGIG